MYAAQDKYKTPHIIKIAINRIRYLYILIRPIIVCGEKYFSNKNKRSEKYDKQNTKTKHIYRYI